MIEDREKWNQRYRGEEYPRHPSKIVQEYASIAPRGRALDLACGNGRNALFLARQGFTVDAVDISDVGLSRFLDRVPNILPICMDLDHFDIPEEKYALILNIRYLSRRLFPYIRDGLMRGGILIFETYMEGEPDEDDPTPSCRDYLLRENELLHAFLRHKILYYREQKGESRKGRSHIASLVSQRIP